MNTVIAETSGAPIAGPTKPLSKSQKKRMKRNKSKLNKEASDRTKNAHTDSTLNAHDAIRLALQNLGFSIDAIDKSIEDMWNLNLDYDDFNAVLKYMTTEQSSSRSIKKEEEPAVESGADHMEQENQLDNRDDQDDHASVSFKITPTVGDDQDLTETLTASSTGTFESDQISRTPENTVAPSKEVKVDNERSTNTNTEENKRNSAQQNLTLNSKLEMVANHTNLTHAIVALTQWVNKAATPFEISELWNGNDSCALKTVITRIVMTSSATNFSGQLLDLIASILRISGSSSSQISSSARAFNNAFTIAKTIAHSREGENINEHIANGIADYIINDVSTTVETFYSSNHGEGAKMMGKLETEISNVKSSLDVSTTHKSQNIVDMLANRDQARDIARNYSNIVNRKMSCRSNCTETSKDDLIAMLLGPRFEAVTSSEAAYDELKKKGENESSKLFENRVTMVANIDTMKAKKNVISDKMKELQLELERLTKESDEMEIQINEAQFDLDSLQESVPTKNKQTDEHMHAVSQNVKLGESVSQLVESLLEFKASINIKTSTSQTTTSAQKQNITDRDMDFYLKSMMNYFNSDLSMLNFIRQRAQGLCEKIPILEMEIKTYKELGMTANVAEMEGRVNEIKDNIADDLRVVKAIQQESVQMKNDFFTLREKYVLNGGDLSPRVSMIQSIEGTAERVILG